MPTVHDLAFKGLRLAVQDFSNSNSEAILAASMLLLWQAREWYVTSNFALVGATDVVRPYWVTLEEGILNVCGICSRCHRR